tara:strand:- start:11570 stop:12130 length:561 start_codon:yes stop_codon:yes gene_type:complete
MDSIGITGNPGTGKKTIASKLSEKISMDLFDINKFIIENKYGQYEKNQLIISDISQIENAIKQKIEGKKYIIIGHLLPELIKKESLWKIFVLRCEPNILIDRYKLRNYEESKIKDNIVSELIGTICYESIMRYGDNNTHEINVSNQSVDNIVDEINNIIDNNIRSTNNIDWLELAHKSENLRRYLN